MVQLTSNQHITGITGEETGQHSNLSGGPPGREKIIRGGFRAMFGHRSPHLAVASLAGYELDIAL